MDGWMPLYYCQEIGIFMMDGFGWMDGWNGSIAYCQTVHGRRWVGCPRLFVCLALLVLIFDLNFSDITCWPLLVHMFILSYVNMSMDFEQ